MSLIVTSQLARRRRRHAEISVLKMNNANRSLQITKQIGDAQKAKTAREQLFNSTVRQSANALQTMQNMQMQERSYMQNMEMSANQRKITETQQKIYSIFASDIDGKKIKNFAELPAEVMAAFGVKKEGDGSLICMDGCMLEKNGNDWQIKSGADEQKLRSYVHAFLQGQMDAQSKDMMKNYIDNQNSYYAMQQTTNTQNYFTNMFNLQSEFIDSAELESLNAIETQLRAEKDQLDTEDTMVVAEIQALEKVQEESAKKDAPKYIA